MVTLIVIGAGSRGNGYAKYALEHPEELKIVGVAEPRAFQREALAQAHGVPAENVFNDWQDLLDKPKLADGVIIATQDNLHADPAVALAAKGYHMLLEKPLAPSAEDCRRIVEAVKRAGVLLGVGHVLRYTAYTQRLKEVLNSGRIGEIVSIQHLEPVGHWHQAHSFVRGNWRNEAESSPMLLSKSCHDVDWLRYVMGKPCVSVSSFGSLRHFRASEQPEGAGDRCVTCPEHVESQCPYSAKRFYLRKLEREHLTWPLAIITDDLTETGVLRALETGPYGRCVYACDNDVVDHQVVNMTFADDSTASFTMTAFSRGRGRETHIFGTRGEIYGDSRTIRIYDFLTDQEETLDTEQTSDGSILSGHGGGDFGLMQAFVRAVAENDPSAILSGPDETLESHLMVFAAETARKEGTVERLESVPVRADTL